MKVSLAWLNEYLEPHVTADEAEALLTAQGLPIESRAEAAGDTVLDVEVTSNRPDCLSHLGLAREIAAGSGRAFKAPDYAVADARPGAGAVESLTSVQNARTDLCSIYTARVIRGVKVGPSPAWMVRRLEALGLRSVNNVVDVTNYVLLEMGQPLHAFDMAKLAERRIVVRTASEGEGFVAIDGSKHKLTSSMLVIADAKKPVAVAGVMGGLESEVGPAAADILLESARFDPLSIRRTSRALKLASDSSYRFERGVDPTGVELASRRAAALIVQAAGGTIAPGVVRAGAPVVEPAVVTMRVERCNNLLGYTLKAGRIVELLARLGLSPRLSGDGASVTATIPTYRLDLQREVDLIEEVARLNGYDHIGVRESLSIVVAPPALAVRARRRLADVLIGERFVETVNFSFVAEQRARGFLEPGAELVRVDDDRRKLEPILRPSLVPSLMSVRKTNQDIGSVDLRLFEIGNTWSRVAGRIVESRRLGLLMDLPRQPGKSGQADYSLGARTMRRVIHELVEAVGGVVALSVQPGDRPGYMYAARVLVGGKDLGFLGLVSTALHDVFKLRTHVAVAEMDFDALVALYPPKMTLRDLPRLPDVERELSLVVSENVTWEQIHREIVAIWPDKLEEVEHLGTFVGKPIPPGKKSVSLRLRFRDSAATLRHEQVDPQVAAVVERLKSSVGAELRA